MQYVADPEASARWYAQILGVDPTPYDAPYFAFDEHAYLILAPAVPGTGRGGSGVWFAVESVAETYSELRAAGFEFNEEPYAIPPGLLVTLNDPDGNIIGFIDDSAGGMPGQTPG